MKIVKDPKITVNKLGEFLVAPASRQRAILKQIKYPRESKYAVAPYGDVRDAIKRFFISDFDYSILHNEIRNQKIKLKNTSLSDWSKTIVDSSIESLQKVIDFNFTCNDLTFKEYTGSNPKVLIHGVEVSINPDLIVYSSSKVQDYVGAFKLHVSKNSKSDENACMYVSSLLHNYATEQFSGSSLRSKHQNSISYDVFKNIFMESPKSFKRKMDDIEAGCMNIRAIWDSI
ncbi:hypothetical protein [uncultured Chryseobacterium sp.]|uniref:hypothetical protein n=1 Tax=uncultured Chryseobacterium sp. TaxID=259322 RepID=UPI0025CC111F|nr:hypothetical protein [uncultured Chryseobacterium sp.]